MDETRGGGRGRRSRGAVRARSARSTPGERHDQRGAITVYYVKYTITRSGRRPAFGLPYLPRDFSCCGTTTSTPACGRRAALPARLAPVAPPDWLPQAASCPE